MPNLVSRCYLIAKYKNNFVGKRGHAAAFSFNGNKLLTTSGGGILASDDEELITKARYWSTQAREPECHFEHIEIGFNYRLSNLLAAIGVGQLECLEERVAKKRQVFDWYSDRLSNVPGIEFMPEHVDGVSNRWLTALTIDPGEFGRNRDQVRLALEKENIESRPVWKPMHLQPCFHGCSVYGGEISEGLFERGLCLPSGTQMEEADIDRVSEIILAGQP